MLRPTTDLILLHLTYQLSPSVSSSSEVRMTAISLSTGRGRIAPVIVLLLTWMDDSAESLKTKVNLSVLERI
jgi:hypothetical protein